jgi:hypothetical protein
MHAPSLRTRISTCEPTCILIPKRKNDEPQPGVNTPGLSWEVQSENPHTHCALVHSGALGIDSRPFPSVRPNAFLRTAVFRAMPKSTTAMVCARASKTNSGSLSP